MNVEELRPVLDLLRTVSGDASTAVIWWIALHYGVSLLKAIAFMVVVLMIVSRICRAILAGDTEWEDAGRTVVSAWGGSPNGDMNTRDREALAEAITTGKGRPRNRN